VLCRRPTNLPPIDLTIFHIDLESNNLQSRSAEIRQINKVNCLKGGLMGSFTSKQPYKYLSLTIK
jgi:hypothetical protein